MSLLLQHIAPVNGSQLPSNLIVDPEIVNISQIHLVVMNAQAYLKRHSGKHGSVTSTQIHIEENFSQCLIQEITEDKYVALSSTQLSLSSKAFSKLTS
jgi:hypothetical protein